MSRAIRRKHSGSIDVIDMKDIVASDSSVMMITMPVSSSVSMVMSMDVLMTVFIVMAMTSMSVGVIFVSAMMVAKAVAWWLQWLVGMMSTMIIPHRHF